MNTKMGIATKPNQWTVAETSADGWARLVAALYEGQDPFPQPGDILESRAKDCETET